jgi:hypothetical protein
VNWFRVGSDGRHLFVMANLRAAYLQKEILVELGNYELCKKD